MDEELELEPEERAALTMRINANASFSNTDIKDAISKQLASIMICSKYLMMRNDSITRLK